MSSRTRNVFTIVIKRGGLLLGVVLIAAQLVPATRDNPRSAVPELVYASAPADVRAVFDGSCKNCHSNQTDWPWYSHVAPFSWIVIHDVHEGRKLLNFSEWNTYSLHKQEEKLESICEQVVNGDMPDGKYLIIHRRARPTQQEQEAVCNWVGTMR